MLVASNLFTGEKYLQNFQRSQLKNDKNNCFIIHSCQLNAMNYLTYSMTLLECSIFLPTANNINY